MSMPLPALASPQALLEHVWQRALNQCSSGSGVVTLPITITESLGQQGILTVMQRFSAFTGRPATLTLDQATGIIQIACSTAVQNPSTPVAPSPSFTTPLLGPTSDNKEKTGPRKASAKRQSRDRIPRPPNAFILYRQHHHPHVKATNPGMHNNDISIILGKQWKNEPAEVRTHFKSLSDELKRKHHLDHPEYQYHPRKASEKKRRISHRTASSRTSLSGATPAVQLTGLVNPAGGMMQLKTAVRAQGFEASLASSSSQTSLEVEKNHHTVPTINEPSKSSRGVFSNANTTTMNHSENTHEIHSSCQENPVYPSPAISEASVDAQENSSNSGSASGGGSGRAQQQATNSGPTAKNSAQGNPQDTGATDNSSGDAGEDKRGSGNGKVRVDLRRDEWMELSLPFSGGDDALTRLLDNWNKEHPLYPAPGLENGAYPITIAPTFGLLDGGLDLVNWSELEQQAHNSLQGD